MGGKFTSGERRGVIVLAALLLIVAVTIVMVRGHYHAPAPNITVNMPAKETGASKRTGATKHKSDSTQQHSKKHGKKKSVKASGTPRQSKPERNFLDETISDK